MQAVVKKVVYSFPYRLGPGRWGGRGVSVLPLRRCETLWSAREIASMARSAEQVRHAKNVFHIALRRGKTHVEHYGVRERESATKAISLPLSFTERVFHIALRRCETLWSAREIASIAPSSEQARHAENVFHIALRQSEAHPVCL